MRAIAPNEPGDYILRVTIIQEGWRWLDFLTPPVCADTPVTIAPELPVTRFRMRLSEIASRLRRRGAGCGVLKSRIPV